MKVTRTYPQPDSPRDLSARERALAAFKYLLNIEPEHATEHGLFDVIENSYQQHGLSGSRGDSLTEELRETRTYDGEPR